MVSESQSDEDSSPLNMWSGLQCLGEERGKRTSILKGQQTEIAVSRPFTPDEIDRLWQRLLYEGTQHTNRVNFYLVAQSMFFAAFASNQRQTVSFSLICVVAGILMSLVWMQMAKDQDIVVQRTRALLREHCLEFQVMADLQGVNSKKRITQKLLSAQLPTIMIILWMLAGLDAVVSYVFG